MYPSRQSHRPAKGSMTAVSAEEYVYKWTKEGAKAFIKAQVEKEGLFIRVKTPPRLDGGKTPPRDFHPDHFTQLGSGSQAEMGNTNAQTKLLNQSNRNMRVFLTKHKLEVDAFIAKLAGQGQGTPPLPQADGMRRFCFRGDVTGHRVLASQTRQFLWEENQHISIFIEDEDDERICSKHICISMPLFGPTAIILYDV